MQTPSISVQTPKSSKISQDNSSSRLGLDRGTPEGDFNQMLNLVSPKAEMNERADNSRSDEDLRSLKERAETGIDKTQTRDRKDVERVDGDRGTSKVEEANAYTNAQAQGASATERILNKVEARQENNSLQAQLRMVSSLSQEDLLKLVEFQNALNGQAGALETQLDTTRFPQLNGLSSGDLMALLNGFQDAKQPDGLQLSPQQQLQWLESQLAQSQLQSNNTNLNSALQAQAQTQLQFASAQQTQMVSMVDAMARPQEVLPTLNLLRLTQAQKEGVIRQVATTFKGQAGQTQTAEIRLHPEELGMVRLKIEMQGNDIRVFFSAEHAAVNDLLSQNMDQLKSLLMDQEMNLAESGLFQDQLSEQLDQEQDQSEDEDYGNEGRSDLRHRPKPSPRLSPLPNRFRATV
jgi:flagellar hook-length control protein FliK